MKLSDLPQSVRPAVARQLHAVPPTTRPPRTDPYRSQLERDYAKHLELRRVAGEIAAWCHEPLKLLLPGGVGYIPDFLVLGWGGDVELHETKGWKWRNNMTKLKIAAGYFSCWPFFLVGRDGGGWKAERVGQ